MWYKFLLQSLLLVTLTSVNSDCSKNKTPGNNNNNNTAGDKITYWVTRADQSVLLQKQSTIPQFDVVSNNLPTIQVDSSQQLQTVDGFGYTLTGGSASVINRLGTTDKAALLQELFGNGANSIGISYLRVSIGASDLNAEVFSYDDMPAGQTDPTLANFSLSKDTVDVIPLLKQILAINPTIKILGSPWSAPVWMKDNNSSIGGHLLPAYYSAYAQYFVKYINAMKANGITVDAVTIQNEPEHGGNNPSMLVNFAQAADFVKNHLGPAFATANITTKIIIWDHNCDNASYPISVLNDAGARQYINGSAFHLYAGDISALTAVHNAYPDKALYFTEQWTGANASFDGDLKWHVRNVVIGSMRNWSRVALEWNLASDPTYNPHTPGGCTECKGALTINGSSITRNVGYYIIAHASKFVPAGSVVISSSIPSGSLASAAFKTPDGKKVLLVLNDGVAATQFNIEFKGKKAVVNLPANSVGTFTW